MRMAFNDLKNLWRIFMSKFKRTKYSNPRFIRTKYPESINHRIGFVIGKLVDDNRTNIIDIAKMCDVNVGKVVKWVRTGNAAQHEVQPIINQFGDVALNADQVSEILIKMYSTICSSRHIVVSITINDLLSISGHKKIRAHYLAQIREALYQNGYMFYNILGQFQLTAIQKISKLPSIEIQKASSSYPYMLN